MRNPLVLVHVVIHLIHIMYLKRKPLQLFQFCPNVPLVFSEVFAQDHIGNKSVYVPTGNPKCTDYCTVL
jgi:hypothetical protein